MAQLKAAEEEKARLESLIAAEETTRSLADDVQDRMYDFLDTVKVDDRFGFYMRRRFYKVKRLAARETLTAFVDLLEHNSSSSDTKISSKASKNK